MGLAWAGKMAQQIKGVCYQAWQPLSLIPSPTWWIENRLPAIYPLDYYTWVVTCMHACIHKVNIRNVLKCVLFGI